MEALTHDDTQGHDVTPPDDDITKTSVPTIRAQLDAAMEAREKAASSSRAKVFAAVLAAGTLLIGIGAVGEQTRQTREDVARVLVIVESLSSESTTTRARLDESERDRTRLRESIRTVEAKMWEARPAARLERP
jgi:hypothetical protein